MSVADRLAPAFRCNLQKASVAAVPGTTTQPLIHFESADPFYEPGYP